MVREHSPQTARSHREEILLPDLEEIYEPRHLVQEEDEEDDKRGLLGHRTPDCSALVDKLHREDRDERVPNCLGETLWMAGDHCT